MANETRGTGTLLLREGAAAALFGTGLAVCLGIPPNWWPDMPKNLVHILIEFAILLMLGGAIVAIVGICKESNDKYSKKISGLWDKSVTRPWSIYIVLGGALLLSLGFNAFKASTIPTATANNAQSSVPVTEQTSVTEYRAGNGGNGGIGINGGMGGGGGGGGGISVPTLAEDIPAVLKKSYSPSDKDRLSTFLFKMTYVVTSTRDGANILNSIGPVIGTYNLRQNNNLVDNPELPIAHLNALADQFESIAKSVDQMSMDNPNYGEEWQYVVGDTSALTQFSQGLRDFAVALTPFKSLAVDDRKNLLTLVSLTSFGLEKRRDAVYQWFADCNNRLNTLKQRISHAEN